VPIFGQGSQGWAILSSPRGRFGRFWLVATTMVGNGGAWWGAGGGAASGFAARLAAGGGFAVGACTTMVGIAGALSALPFFFGGGCL